jgi:hypothetical protein
MLNYLFSMQWDTLTQEELVHVCNSLYYPGLEDRYLADNPKLYPYIKWDRLEKMQAVRVATRNLDLLKVIDLKKHQYRIREIFFLILRNHQILFEYFNFDFNNLNQDDAYFLLCLGKEDFLKMVDITKYNFNFIEAINILRAYNYKREVMLALDYENLKSYQIAEILIMTGEEYLDLFSLDCLNTLDWLKILMYQPDFLSRCDFEKFIAGDPFNLIQLIVLFDKPDLSYLLESIDLKKITPFGWEKLLIARPDKYASLCDFRKLNEANWAVISNYSPELLVFKM